MRTPCKHTSDKRCSDEERGRKLVMAELEVLHLKKFFDQVTEKYTEDVRKLEEKVQLSNNRGFNGKFKFRI